MNKQLFRATEKKLYDYFQSASKVSCLRLKIKLLKNHIKDIQERIKETDISIPSESRSTTYEERVQTSASVLSYAERTAIKIIEDMENEIIYKKSQIVEIEKEIRKIEIDNAIIDYNLAFLTDEDRLFLELKYKQEKKDWQIGQVMNMSQSTATRTRQRLVEDVARWDNLLKLENMH